MSERPQEFMETTKTAFIGFDHLPIPSTRQNEPDWKFWTGKEVLLFDQSHRGKIELTGPHAAPFLHNLCSNDIKGMPLGAGCEAFFADKTARYISLANIYHLILGDGRHAFWLDLPPGSSLPMISHLDKHLVSEQVEFADRSAEFAQFHISGAGSTQLLSQAIAEDIPELGQHQHMVRTIGGRIPTSIRRNDKLGQIGYDLIILSNRAPTLWQVLVENGAFPAGEDSYQGLRIKSGFPEEPGELESSVRVMEVDRPKTAIADNKGCYLGQEPIVMARDRGQLNRKLRRVKIQASGLSSGAFSVDGKEIGRLCSHTGLGNGVWLGLAYLRRGFWETGSQWACESSNGPMILEVL
jgi:folate-binding protein YgfZ